MSIVVRIRAGRAQKHPQSGASGARRTISTGHAGGTLLVPPCDAIPRPQCILIIRLVSVPCAVAKV